MKLRRCGRRLRSLRRPQHGPLRPRRLLAALLPSRSKRGCNSRQRSCLRRGRSRLRTRCTRPPRPGRSSAASSSISSLGASGPTRSSRTGRRRSGSCKPSRWTATRARCRTPAGSGTEARCARSTSAARTTHDSGAAYVWVRFDGDPYDCKLHTESLKRGGDAFLVRQVLPASGAA